MKKIKTFLYLKTVFRNYAIAESHKARVYDNLVIICEVFTFLAKVQGMNKLLHGLTMRYLPLFAGV